MSFLFGSPKTPPIQPLPPAPDEDDEEVRRREAEERARIRRMQGRSSTILTQQGKLGEAFIASKTLLGGR